MAFIKTSDSIIIKAVLTDEGKKLLSRGKFKIAKFALGDDEIDYSLLDANKLKTSMGYVPALNNSELFESYSNHHKNIQFGLMSYDTGFINLRSSQLQRQIGTRKALHSEILYIPNLLNNDILSISPTVTGSVICLSVNDETTSVLNKISDFKFLSSNNFNNCKIVVESGITDIEPSSLDDPNGDSQFATKKSREELIVKKYFLDNEFEVMIDDRFIRSVIGVSQNSKFENYASGDSIVRFTTSDNVIYPISKPTEFSNHSTYILRSIPNLMFDFASVDGATDIRSSSAKFCKHNGPRGTVLAFNLLVDDEIKINSTSETNFKFTKFGTTDKILFSELPSSKFDYIDSTIYIIGSSTNSRLSIPIRILRYSGT